MSSLPERDASPTVLRLVPASHPEHRTGGDDRIWAMLRSAVEREAGVRWLYEKYSVALVAAAMRRGVDEDTAMEIVDDVFMKLLSLIDAGSASPEHLGAYLTRLVQNRAENVRTSASRRQRRNERWVAETLPLAEQPVSLEPDEQQVAMDRWQQVLSALPALGEKDRLVLAILQESVRTEVGEKVLAEEKQLGYVAYRKQKSRTLQKLRSLLGMAHNEGDEGAT
jgi:RNA polymerase sigma factor (sigma-70 family)